MAKQLLRDYLPLYLGCEILWNGYYKERLTIDLLKLIFSNPELSKPQLILRPLSSMTEEEQFESTEALYESLKWTRDTVLVYASKIKYLLALHFDLFGLIEAGLAIDATTLNQTEL